MAACALLLVVLWAGPTLANELRALRISGPASNMDIVVVAEGYRQADKAGFFADAAEIATGLLDYGPYRDTAALVNIHALFVPSKQAGADHPSRAVYVDTAFDATYDSNGIGRLITFSGHKVLAAVGEAMPSYSMAVLLVNDDRYGGSGGSVASVSTNRHAIAILRHELAHAIGGLADEYETPYPGKPVADPEPNVALAANLSPLKWGAWVEPGTPIPTPDSAATSTYEPIGAYEGARYRASGMYRPAPGCLMRSLDHDFCKVCYEAVIKGVHEQARTIHAFWPHDAALSCAPGACPRLEIETAPLDSYEVLWTVAGQARSDSWFFRPGRDDRGELEVRVDVRRLTDAVRSDSGHHLRDSQTWKVSVVGQPAPTPPSPAPPADHGCGVAWGAGGDPRALMAVLMVIGLARRRT